jgi:hypothetical protein
VLQLELCDTAITLVLELWNENTAIDDLIGTAVLELKADSLQLGQCIEVDVDTGGALSCTIRHIPSRRKSTVVTDPAAVAEQTGNAAGGGGSSSGGSESDGTDDDSNADSTGSEEDDDAADQNDVEDDVAHSSSEDGGGSDGGDAGTPVGGRADGTEHGPGGEGVPDATGAGVPATTSDSKLKMAGLATLCVLLLYFFLSGGSDADDMADFDDGEIDGQVDLQRVHAELGSINRAAGGSSGSFLSFCVIFVLGASISAILKPTSKANASPAPVMQMKIRAGTKLSKQDVFVAVLQHLDRKLAVRTFYRWKVQLMYEKGTIQQCSSAQINVLRQQRAEIMKEVVDRTKRDAVEGLDRANKLFKRLQINACMQAFWSWRLHVYRGAGQNSQPSTGGQADKMQMQMSMQMQQMQQQMQAQAQALAQAQMQAQMQIQAQAQAQAQAQTSQPQVHGQEQPPTKAPAPAQAAQAAQVQAQAQAQMQAQAQAQMQAMQTMQAMQGQMQAQSPVAMPQSGGDSGESAQAHAAIMLKSIMRYWAMIYLRNGFWKWRLVSQVDRISSCSAAESLKKEQIHVINSIIRVQKKPVFKAFMHWKLQIQIDNVKDYAERMMQKGKMKANAVSTALMQEHGMQVIKYMLGNMHKTATGKAFWKWKLGIEGPEDQTALEQRDTLMSQLKRQEQLNTETERDASEALARKEKQVMELLSQLDTREAQIQEEVRSFEAKMKEFSLLKMETQPVSKGRKASAWGITTTDYSMQQQQMPPGMSPYGGYGYGSYDYSGSSMPDPGNSAAARRVSTVAAKRKQSVHQTNEAIRVEDDFVRSSKQARSFWLWKLQTFSSDGTGKLQQVDMCLLEAALAVQTSITESRNKSSVSSVESHNRRPFRLLPQVTFCMRVDKLRSFDGVQQPFVEIQLGDVIKTSTDDSKSGGGVTAFNMPVQDIKDAITITVKDTLRPDVIVGQTKMSLKSLNYKWSPSRWFKMYKAPAAHSASKVLTQQEVAGEAFLQVKLETPADVQLNGSNVINGARKASTLGLLTKGQIPSGTENDSTGRFLHGFAARVPLTVFALAADGSLRGMMPVRISLSIENNAYKTLLLDPHQMDQWTGLCLFCFPLLHAAWSHVLFLQRTTFAS